MNIDKNTLKVCDPSNQRNEENHNDSTIAQIHINTDETNAQILDNAEVIKDDNMKSLDEPNETIYETDSVVNYFSYKDHHDDLEIETEDEFDTNDNFVKSPSNVDKNIAKIPVNESLSANTQIKNSQSVNSEKINQNNIAGSQGLENDSVTECAVGSCAGDTLEFNKLIFNKKTAVNVSPVETDNSYQHYVEKMDSSVEKSFNDITLQNSSTINLQNNNDDTKNPNSRSSNQQTTNSSSVESINNLHKQNSSIIDLQDDNGNVNFNIESPNQQKDEQTPVMKQLPNLEQTGVPIKNVNNVESQDSNILGLQDNRMDDFNEIQPQKNPSSDSLQDMPKVDNQQNNNNYKQSLEKNNESDIVNDILSNTVAEEKLRDYDNPSTISESPDYSKEINYSKDDFLIESIDQMPEVQNTFENVPSNNESVPNVLNDDSVVGNMTHSSPLQNIKNETDNASSTKNQTTVVGEVNITEMNKNLIDQCTSENECEHSIDGTSKHNYESIQPQYNSENKVLPYENVYTSVKPNNNENLKEFEPKSYVTSFGHPDTCSGVNCLKFKRNTEKIIKPSQPLHSVSDKDQDAPVHLTETKFEKENVIDKQPDKELSILDIFQNVLSSPTLNSIDFLWNIFGKYSNEHNGK